MRFTVHDDVLEYMKRMRSHELTIKLDQLTSC